MNNAPQNFNCPPLMNDGRFITDYRPSCTSMYAFQRANGIMTSYQLRLFMQRYGEMLMAADRSRDRQNYSCTSCQFFANDPNRQDAFWAQYKRALGW